MDISTAKGYNRILSYSREGKLWWILNHFDGNRIKQEYGTMKKIARTALLLQNRKNNPLATTCQMSLLITRSKSKRPTEFPQSALS